MNRASLTPGAKFLVTFIIGLVILGAWVPIVNADAGTLGPWSETTDYGASSGNSGTSGVPVQSQSCVTYSSYVYCVGGVAASAYSSKSYFAPLTSTGVGGWSETTDYGAASSKTGGSGIPLGDQSCVAYNGYVYCVGGYSYFPATHQSSTYSDVFYAPLSSSGIGAWTETTDYGAASGSSGTGGVALSQLSCFTSTSYIYCVGGVNFSTNGALTSKVFFAQMSSTGVGPWAETTDYGAPSGSTGSGGIKTDPECVVVNATAICIGGSLGSSYISKVFYSTLSSSGIGPWAETTDYGAASGTSGAGGLAIERPSCAAANGTIVCVGGYDQPVNTVYQGTPSFGGQIHVSVGWVKDGLYPKQVYELNCIWFMPVPPSMGGTEVDIICIGGNASSTAAGQFGGASQEAPTSAVWKAVFALSSTTSTSTTSTTSSSSSSSSTTSTSSTTSASTSSTTSTIRTTTSNAPEFPSAILPWLVLGVLALAAVGTAARGRRDLRTSRVVK